MSDGGRALYRAILASLQGFFPPDSRELEWDVLPRTIAWKLTQFQRERDEAVGRLSAARAEGEARLAEVQRERDCRTCASYLPIDDPTGAEKDWCLELRLECHTVAYRCGFWRARAAGGGQ
jgi:hypothetical protein